MPPYFLYFYGVGNSKMGDTNKKNVFTVQNRNLVSPSLLIAEHSGNEIPLDLDNLGLSSTDRQRHISYDIGIKGVCEIASSLTSSRAIFSRYSRLVVDLNRHSLSNECIRTESDGTLIPGNRELSEAQKKTRINKYYKPFKAIVSDTINAIGPKYLLSLHSFTPKLLTEDLERPWHCGVLYDSAIHLATDCLGFLRSKQSIIVGDNEPYGVNKKSGHTISIHGDERKIPAIIVEIRQDLISHERGQKTWGELIAEMMKICFR